MIKKLLAVIIMAIAGTISIVAQNLTAAQMSIYFGQPRQTTTHGEEGIVTTSFDTQGRVVNVAQGNMRMVYEWADDGKSVAVSMYNGETFQDGGIIEIEEMTPTHYKYKIGVMSVIVEFKKNGAIDKIVMSNMGMTASTIYHYHQESDMYPYAIEQIMGEQSAKKTLTIDKTDAYGNAVEITQEFLGQKAIASQVIEYY